MALNRQLTSLSPEEQYILTTTLLSGPLEKVLLAERDEINVELANLNIPMDWSMEHLTTFLKEYQKRTTRKLVMNELLELIAIARKHYQEQ